MTTDLRHSLVLVESFRVFKLLELRQSGIRLDLLLLKGLILQL